MCCLFLEAMGDDTEKTTLIFMDRDLLKIPCFRTTFLYSISSWIGVSLVTFLFTSKGNLASHCGFASFMIVTGGYFVYCRHNYAQEKFRMGQLKQAWQKGIALEGTETDNERPKLVEV